MTVTYRSRLVSAIRSRRSSVDKRPDGVQAPRWEEKESDDKIVALSAETIELLALASLDHVCEDTDFEISYSYGSGIGTNIVAKCQRCGERFDVTDYGNW